MPPSHLQVHLSDTQAPWFLYPHSALDQLSWHHFVQSLLPESVGTASTVLVADHLLAPGKALLGQSSPPDLPKASSAARCKKKRILIEFCTMWLLSGRLQCVDQRRTVYHEQKDDILIPFSG